ncbi:MAG: biotin--[acetyl-CoA-carboxylase] ligase [Candidatus Krumholzibacteriota bacterium]|nr:biotin--[acetyl-CoA-carboxylase] ligase [Candidatus Krumholzibacteriota bacterium]
MTACDDFRLDDGCEWEELHPARLLGMMASTRLGRTVTLYDEIDSTNRAAAEAAAGGAPEGAVFIARRQYAGRGRKGRDWVATEDGSLVFSIILRPSRSPESLTTLLALAVARTVDRISPELETSIKWPNDIFIDGKKAAGILAESKGNDVIVGTGIDINETIDDFPEWLREIAVSLRIVSGMRFDRGKILAGIIAELEDLYSRWEREGLSVLKFDVERKLLWKGMEASIDTGAGIFSGVITGITSEGYLRMISAGGEEIFQTGDVAAKAGG